MINNITKYFSLTTQNLFNNKGPITAINNIKLQQPNITIINRILITFFKKYYILISKPIFTMTPSGIKISILYYLPIIKRFSKIRSNRRMSWKQKKRYLKRMRRMRRRTRLIKKKAFLNRMVTRLVQANYNNINTQVPGKSKRGSRVMRRSQLTFLVVLLSKILQTNVQIEIVRLKYVYHDSNIFAQFLGINSHKTTYGRFKKWLRRRVKTKTNSIQLVGPDKPKKNLHLYKDDLSPVTKLTGFKIKISGRLARQRVVPKKTVKTTYKGAITPNKYNLVDQATFTGKNKKGAYSIRVWTSHGTTPIRP